MERRDIESLLSKIRTYAGIQNPELEASRKVHNGIYCKRCNSTGYIVVERNGYKMMTYCPDCHERREVARHLRESGISPADYNRYTLETFRGDKSETAQKMLDLANRYLEAHAKGERRGIGFFGRSGTGKTHICIAICQELTRKFHEPHFYFNYTAEIEKLAKSANSYHSDYMQETAKWRTCQNLYIDDFLKLSGTVQNGHLVSIKPEHLRVIFDIINARYLNHAATLFSSEYSLNDIAKIDEALGSRIYEMIKPYGLYVTGKNQRLAN